MTTVVITPGVNRIYRVWLRGRVVCETDCTAKAIRARDAALAADQEARAAKAMRDADRWNLIHKARARAQRLRYHA